MIVAARDDSGCLLERSRLDLARRECFAVGRDDFDRNAGNLLVDDDWNLYLIDHSRAFIWDKDMAVKMQSVDREFWDKIQALDEAQLTAALGKWVDKDGIRAMLTRRERMRKEIDKMVTANGEAAVFVK